jgi:hypothetical protein
VRSLVAPCRAMGEKSTREKESATDPPFLFPPSSVFGARLRGESATGGERVTGKRDGEGGEGEGEERKRVSDGDGGEGADESERRTVGDVSSCSICALYARSGH